VHVSDPLMERFAVPVEDGDLLAPFLDIWPPPDRRFAAALQQRALAIAGRRPRFEPRNMGFADGLDRWDLDLGGVGPFADASQADAGAGAQAPPAGDYTASAAEGSAMLSSAVPQPRGSAALVQTIYADDYRNTTVAFRAEVRTNAASDQAALRMQVLRRGWIVRPELIETRDVNLPGDHDWARREITAPVPGNADYIRFGVTLTGPGRIELRNPDLGAPQTPAPSGP
jgi:hypothetical protein